jgi:hypothetical protein
MAKSSGFPQQLAELCRQNRLPMQTTGVALAVGGFAGLWWLAPANLAAQLSASLFGLAIVLFAQFFFSIRKLKPEERRSLEAVGVCCLVLCLAGTLGAAGYHWAARRAGGGGGGGGGTASGGAPQSEVTFASDEPNRLLIGVPIKNPHRVVIEVQRIWELAPDTKSAEALDWPHGPDFFLEAEKKCPYKETALSGRDVPIQSVLQPILPDLKAEPIQVADRWVTRLSFAKPPAKDYAYQLKVEVVTTQGKAINAGTVVYFPDFKTKYEKLSPANQEVLREIAEVPAVRSPKLAELIERLQGAAVGASK